MGPETKFAEAPPWFSRLKNRPAGSHLLEGTVIAGEASAELAKKIAKRLGARLVKAEKTLFPDGECKITLKGKPSGRKIVIVQSVYPPVDTNLMAALALVARAAESAKRTVAVIPYMGYARQDREFLPGEIVTMKVIARLFRCAGASEIVLVDIHSRAGLEYFEMKTTNITAIPDLAKHFKKQNLKDPLVVSPDQGGRLRAEEFAGLCGLDCMALAKDRDRKTGKVQIKTRSADAVKGRDVIIVDDMISTGGSIVKATKFLKKQGCKRVYVACTHALLIGDAREKITRAGVAEIVSTNTIPGRTSSVDISGAIAKAIR